MAALLVERHSPPAALLAQDFLELTQGGRAGQQLDEAQAAGNPASSSSLAAEAPRWRRARRGCSYLHEVGQLRRSLASRMSPAWKLAGRAPRLAGLKVKPTLSSCASRAMQELCQSSPRIWYSPDR